MLDQVAIIADESSVGLPTSSIDDVRGLVARVPFKPALTLVARFAQRLWPIRNRPEAHGEMAREVYGDSPVVERLLEVQRLASGEAPVYLFSEQQLFVLARLIVESASGDLDETWTPEKGVVLNQALFATTSIIGEGATRVRQDAAQLVDWLGFMLQNGAYNAYGPPLGAYVRTWRIYVELARTAEAQSHPDFSDFESWHRDISGVGLQQLFAVGVASAQNAQNEYADDERRMVVPPLVHYLAGTPLAAEADAFTTALSATRDEYAAGFARSRENPLRLAWDRTPFLTKPFFRLADDALLLISPRAAQAFLTDDVHYRLLDAAIARQARERFTTFVGWLFERYVVELFTAALGERPPGGGTVLAEQPYRSGQRRTSDVALDFGVDLVLIEIVSTRMPLGVRVEADQSELGTYLTRTVTDKLGQLDRVIDDLQSDAARLPGVSISDVARIWPVLVTAGDLVEGEPLWDFVTGATGALLKQQGVQPVTLLGVPDVETLAALLASGRDLIALLHDKSHGGYRGLSLGRYLHDRGEGRPPRLPLIAERWAVLSEVCMAVLRADQDPPSQR